jgi:hypothetical protein
MQGRREMLMLKWVSFLVILTSNTTNSAPTAPLRVVTPTNSGPLPAEVSQAIVNTTKHPIKEPTEPIRFYTFLKAQKV